MGTRTVTVNPQSNNMVVNPGADIGLTLPTGEYPNGAITFSSGQWKNNKGTARTVDFYLASSSAGADKVKIGEQFFYGTQRVGKNDFSISGATGLAGKSLYLYCLDQGDTTCNNFCLTTKSDITITTSLQSWTLTTAVSPTGGGTVTSGGSLNYGGTKSLTATPATGYSFSSWSKTAGTLSTTTAATTTFTMGTSNATVTANFVKNSYTLTTAVSPSGYGTVTAGGSLQYQATKSLTATANTGRYFSSWSKTAGTLSSTSTNPTTFTMGAGAATVTANFGTNNYTLTVSKGTGISAVTGGGSKAYASSNAITATASTGYSFKNWTSNNGGTFANANSSSTNFTMPAGNVTVTANGQINSYALTVAKGTGIASVTGGGTVNYASSNNISATASTGYTFSKWTSNNGGTFGNANAASTTFTMPAGAVTVTATATINSYTLTTAVSPSGGGTVTAGGSLNYGGTKSLTATASTGYTFSSWSKTAGTLSSTTTNPTTFTMGTSAATVTANFTHNQYTLTLGVSPTGGGTVSGGGTKYYADSCSISAVAATGYSFKNWTTSSGGTIANANAASTTYTMPNGNATVTANFNHDSYTLSSAVSPSGGGTVTLGATSGYYGSSISISASPATGYAFSGWTTTGGTLGNASAASTTITMPTANVTVTASFTAIDYSVTTATDPAGAGTVTANPSTAHYGDTVTLSQVPATGYAFDGYTSSPSVTITNSQFAMPASNVTITGNYHVSNSSCTLDKSTYSGGDTAEMTINVASSDFTHRYKLSFGTGMETGWVSLAAGIDSEDIYIPIAWSLNANGETTVTGGTLTLETYDQGTLLGTYTVNNLTYTAMDSTIPELKVWRQDSGGNSDVAGEYVGYDVNVPESISTYGVTHDTEPLGIDSNHNVTLSMTYESETFTIVRDIPKVICKQKRTG